MQPEAFLSIGVLVMSVVIHEVCHGYAALAQGDRTAMYEGRLTLNPIKHIDPFGSIILPLILFILPPHITFGWAKPVPFNPHNLRDARWGPVLVALAGPASNFTLALIFGLIIRFGANTLPSSAVVVSFFIVMINLSLAVFNMMPIPPLDGSKVLFGLLPPQYDGARDAFFANATPIFLLFAFFGWRYISPIIFVLFTLITGVSM